MNDSYDRIHAPWDPEQVENLEEYQNCGYCHEFTGNGCALIPTSDGWVEQSGGPVVQTWAYRFMVDGSFRSLGKAIEALKARLTR